MPDQNPLPDMDEADAANGEPGAADERTSPQKPATGEDQARENEENDPPG